jgi:hypothetical protein
VHILGTDFCIWQYWRSDSIVSTGTKRRNKSQTEEFFLVELPEISEEKFLVCSTNIFTTP